MNILNSKKLRRRLIDICKRNNIVFFAVFGSFARGKQRKKSDVDVLIKFSKNSGKTLFDIVEIENSFKKLFKKKVDLLEIDGLNKYIKKDVLNSMKLIYEKR